jgi:hypothetical protein
MKLFCKIVILLSLSEAFFALPIPNADRRRSISIPWRKYLPTIGALGLLGSLAALTFLGTKADEVFKSRKMLRDGETEAKFASLPPGEQNYFVYRMSMLGQELTPSLKESTQAMDQANGWPKLEMPDLSGLDRATRKEIKSKYGKLQDAMNKVALTQESREKAVAEAQLAESIYRNAQYEAAVIARMEWKEALGKAKVLRKEG